MRKFIIVLFVFLLMFVTNNASANAPKKTQEAFVTTLFENIREYTYWSESYQAGIWDCSNMSAVLYLILIDYGIETKIVCGEREFFKTGASHAMIKAKIDGEWRMIEATWPGFVSNEELKEWGWRSYWDITLEEAVKYYGKKEFGTLI